MGESKLPILGAQDIWVPRFRGTFLGGPYDWDDLILASILESLIPSP